MLYLGAIEQIFKKLNEIHLSVLDSKIYNHILVYGGYS